VRGRFKCHNPSRFFCRKSLDPTPPLGKGVAQVAIDERSRRTRHQITVSIRLGKTVFVADVPKDKRQADPPLGKGPKTSRVLLS
jgi:hypothetical protein